MKHRRKPEDPAALPKPAGSPQPGEPVFLVVGKLRRPHGVQGEIQMELITDSPERLKPGLDFYAGEGHMPVTLVSIRPHNKLALVAFEGFDSPESAGLLTNMLLYIKRDTLPSLPDGEYYHFQLTGLKVVSAGGEPLGTLAEILTTGSNDVYVVKNSAGQEILLPAREEVILKVDLDKGEMTVQPPEWLD